MFKVVRYEPKMGKTIERVIKRGFKNRKDAEEYRSLWLNKLQRGGLKTAHIVEYKERIDKRTKEHDVANKR